jgi:hypothetical protein
MKKNSDYFAYENTPLYNIFEYPEGLDLEQLCEKSCKDLVKMVAKGSLKTLDALSSQ